ncbi:5-methyltetrahydropteroyltriglutamate-homocysteine methyltransferase [Rhizodiscina lignyota]|uniref:5-methyltetrahydropteroyltriglutamate-homocysteine methyltransferase n=1 Tax=Rhizodiscina lignyota TaxID=1504668 RepID=A0A9P4IJ22_9PEZI|nr:5-methyltetrahydropteroyltriglutamate-homocysteine methyltransferase [Rhizodiscina lignyota]
MPPPFRAEHIGSLIRPQMLLDARKAAHIDQNFQGVSPEIKQATESAISEVVKQQLSRDVRPLTTGEFERHIFYGGFFENIEGFEIRDLPIPEAFRTNFAPTALAKKMGHDTRESPIATGKMKRPKSTYMDDWMHLRNLLPEEQWKECKFTMPPPTQSHIAVKPGMIFTPESGYTSEKEYFSDLAEIYREEMADLYDAGLRDIQVDDPYMTFLLADWYLEGLRLDGEDPDDILDMYIWAHNECLKRRPADLHVGIHLCRGNFAGHHFASGSYDRIAKKMFSYLDYDTYYLEYDTERAGGFEPLKDLPVGKNVVLGVVSTKTPELEDVDECVARIHEAADVIANGQGRTRDEVLRDMGVSPQCGFGSFSLAQPMTDDQQWAKLALVRQIAQKIWGNEAK